MLKVLQFNFKTVAPSKLRLFRYSTKPALKEQNRDRESRIKEFKKSSHVSPKQRTKKPQKPPFVKNFLLGIFDTDILTYPELQNEDLTALNEDVQQAKTILEQPDITECIKVSKQFLKKLGEGRLLGLQAPQIIGGRDLSVTEMCRMFEAISTINLKNDIINNENLGIQTLIKFGSDDLKRKYLQPLINGECLSALCIVDPLSTNIDVYKRTASLTPDGKTWLLNGEKTMVINGSNANFYVVLAHTSSIVKDELQQQKFTAFMVERDFGGVTSHQQKTVYPYLEVSDVTFENTPVPAENIIGKIDAGEHVLGVVYPQHRLSTGPIASVLIKNVLSKVTEHYINLPQQPYLLHETDAVRSKIGELVTSLYAVESMVYLTAGLMDNYDSQDCELETAIVKVFASEQALLSCKNCADLIGAQASLEKHWFRKLYEEAICHVTLNDNNDSMKTIIALFGLRHAGEKLNDLVNKIRNPLYHATFILKRMWFDRGQGADKPKLILNLHHYLHPSCVPAARRLEYCVLRLQYATETLFARYGSDVAQKHADLRRLADCLMDIYAMTASISRASRSYCIGLQHCEYEMTLANAFSINAMERVKWNIEKIIGGPYETNDESYRVSSERLFRFKEYFPVHPLTRNF